MTAQEPCTRYVVVASYLIHNLVSADTNASSDFKTSKIGITIKMWWSPYFTIIRSQFNL